MPLTDDLTALRRVADDLDETLAATRADIEAGIRAQWPDWDDAAVAHATVLHQDRNGRSVLLDAMSTLVMARSAIMQGEIAAADYAVYEVLPPTPAPLPGTSAPRT